MFVPQRFWQVVEKVVSRMLSKSPSPVEPQIRWVFFNNLLV